MFVYIWKDGSGVPFYVGFTNSTRRTNPQNSPKRNWLCVKKLDEVGRDHVTVELRFVDSIITGQELERKLIQEYGRIQTGTGPLTNLMPGGEGANRMPEEAKELRRKAMLDPNNPIRSPESVRKRNLALKKRMNVLQVLWHTTALERSRGKVDFSSFSIQCFYSIIYLWITLFKIKDFWRF